MMEFVAAVLGIFGAILGAIVGAVGGALFSRRLRRAQPTVTVDHMEITNSPNPTDEITPDITLISALEGERLLYFLTPNYRGLKVNEKLYTDSLQQDLTTIESWLNYVLPSVARIAEQLRTHLSIKDYEAFENAWSEGQGELWQLLHQAFILEHVEYSPGTPDYAEVVQQNQGEQRVIELGDSDTGYQSTYSTKGFIVTTEKHRPISFQWLQEDSQPGDVTLSAKRAAYAIAYRRSDDIEAIVRFLLSARPRYEPRLLELRRGIEQELETHHRLLVKGQVSNTGGSSFSITNKGRIFIETKGYLHTYTDDDGNRQQLRVPEDTHVDILVRDAQITYDSAQVPAQAPYPTQGPYDSPISVASGEVKRFVAVSEQRIKDIDPRGILTGAFKGGDRDFYMGVLTILPGAAPLQPKYAGRQIFRDWKTENYIPPIPRSSS
jgi:hypothetical protein